MRPIPAQRRRYPNDMALARQSEVDQSVNGGQAGGGPRPDLPTPVLRECAPPLRALPPPVSRHAAPPRASLCLACLGDRRSPALYDMPVVGNGCDDMRMIDLAVIPDRYCTAVPTPQDVRLPIAVVITRVGDMPVVSDNACRGNDVAVVDLAVVPDRGRAVVVPPEDVAMAIAV